MYIKSADTNLDEIIARQGSSCSLEGALYNDPEIFQLDLDYVIAKQWQLVDHASRIPNRGDFFLFEVGNESIIIVRGSEDLIHAHYNVCCHRGSRLCLENEGRTNLIVCPYHAWSYRQDGTLANAPHMPEDFEASEVSLKSCHLKVCEGLIFICLADEPPDFAANIEGIDSFFQLHGTATCKIAHRHTFKTLANWKLAVENFIECYHCLAAHPEFCTLHSNDMILNAGAGPASTSADAVVLSDEMKEFEARAAALGQLPKEVNDSATPNWYRFAARSPMIEGAMTESEDGKPMAPLLKGLKDWDNGYTGMAINPISHILATNDVCILFKFTPTTVETCDAEVIWLVNADAEEGKDYDVDRVKWTWETTGFQDLTITENNQKGVNSRAYVPHRHSLLEANVTAFCQWYLANLKKALA